MLAIASGNLEWRPQHYHLTTPLILPPQTREEEQVATSSTLLGSSAFLQFCGVAQGMFGLPSHAPTRREEEAISSTMFLPPPSSFGAESVPGLQQVCVYSQQAALAGTLGHQSPCANSDMLVFSLVECILCMSIIVAKSRLLVLNCFFPQFEN